MARGVNTKANGIDFRANRFDEFLKLIPQNLTDAEKAQVLENIGAIGEEDTLMTINGTGVKKGDAVTTAETAIVVDGEMSDSSQNPVQNKVVKAYADYAKDAVIEKKFGKNLFDKDNVTLNKFLWHDSSGELIAAGDSYAISDYIQVIPGETYTQSPGNIAYTDIHFYDMNKNYIGYSVKPITVTIPNNAYYVRLSVIKNDLGKSQFEVGNSATDYERFTMFKGYNVAPKEVEEIIITCKRYGVNGVDADFCGLNAIGDALQSIADASRFKHYTIMVEGHFVFDNQNLVEDGGSFKYIINKEPTAIWSKEFVSIVGLDSSKAVIEVRLPDGLEATDFPFSDELQRRFTYTDYNPIYMLTDADISNITFIASNCRYACHIEKQSDSKIGAHIHVNNCKFTYRKCEHGNKSVVTFGLIPNCSILFENCVLENYNIGGGVFGGHGPLRAQQDGVGNCSVECVNCNFRTPENFANFQTYSYNRKDVVSFKNCKFNDFTRFGLFGSSTNKRELGTLADLSFTNAPYPFSVKPYSATALRISTLVGSGSSVRFDENCTAFGIVGNPNDGSIEILDNSAIKTYGYEYKDDLSGSHSYACGWINIDPTTGNSIGKILGDCSLESKTLTISINGVDYDVVFDEDMTDVQNSSIINKINGVIGDVAICDTFNPEYNIFPKFDGVEIGCENVSGEKIELGMGVVKTNVGKIRKAKSTDGRIDGICIDDIYPGQNGRIITGGELYGTEIMTGTEKHYIAKGVESGFSFGDKYVIDADNDGVFVKDNSSQNPILKITGWWSVQIIR